MGQSIAGAKGTLAKGMLKVLTIILLVLVAAAAPVSGAEPEQISHTSAPLSEEVFHEHISDPIVQSRCVNCHVEGGLSGHTQLVFVRESDTPDHETLNLQTFVDFLDVVGGGHERILTKIQGAGHGGGVQVPVGSSDFENMDYFLTLLAGHSQGFVERLLEELDDAESSLLFGITTPADGNVLAGNAVAVSATGAPTEAVHFAYRPANDPESEFMYLGAAANRGAALFVWDTTALMDADYELAALFMEDEGESATYDAFELSVDNVTPTTLPDIVEDRGNKTQALEMDAAYEVITADGVVVTVPAGALDSDDRITIAEADPADAETAPGDVIGKVIDIALDSGRDTFAEAVTLGIPYYEGKAGWDRARNGHPGRRSVYVVPRLADGRLGVDPRVNGAAECGHGGRRRGADRGIRHLQCPVAAGRTGRRARHEPRFRV